MAARRTITHAMSVRRIYWENTSRPTWQHGEQSPTPCPWEGYIERTPADRHGSTENNHPRHVHEKPGQWKNRNYSLTYTHTNTSSAVVTESVSRIARANEARLLVVTAMSTVVQRWHLTLVCICKHETISMTYQHHDRQAGEHFVRWPSVSSFLSPRCLSFVRIWLFNFLHPRLSCIVWLALIRLCISLSHVFSAAALQAHIGIVVCIFICVLFQPICNLLKWLWSSLVYSSWDPLLVAFSSFCGSVCSSCRAALPINMSYPKLLKVRSS